MGISKISNFLNPASVQRTQVNGQRYSSNPIAFRGVSSIQYERAPKQGTFVQVTDNTGTPLLPGYMPPGMTLDCLA